MCAAGRPVERPGCLRWTQIEDARRDWAIEACGVIECSFPRDSTSSRTWRSGCVGGRVVEAELCARARSVEATLRDFGSSKSLASILACKSSSVDVDWDAVVTRKDHRDNG